jgi:polyisoprenoid-binding protein YceI
MYFHFIITLSSLLLAQVTYAKAPCYSVKNKDITVGWTAYKTPAKAGVKGRLPKLKYTGKNKVTSIESLIKSASLTIDTNSVATKNPARDKKISSFFFGNMKKGMIMTAKVKSFSKKSLNIAITANGKTKVVPMSYDLNDTQLTAKGYIDVLDFSMGKSLAAINKACFALHQGKTWSDVEINLKVSISKCSK